MAGYTGIGEETAVSTLGATMLTICAAFALQAGNSKEQG
ncbi:unnamed protein product [Dibothriocephalus latus]|uniref:Uncharacterized protein n=1 Tax=Dibothriocephalus latus TaxID=60516 RepID=A0A3P7NG07_DIBLA|nr:unnamed protein product [Dibothriocephalus latus]